MDKERLTRDYTHGVGGKRSTKVWLTNVPIWRKKEGDIKKYEINISAEYLNIGYLETILIILHQMIHLYCMVNQIKDTSRNREYHNNITVGGQKHCPIESRYFSGFFPLRVQVLVPSQR
ncbi:hypothetical protein [Paenibacillus lautus]|uniref:hypothetical protein n=1 Tax=Paenibacillus lautus TaxID=1401 RepID=UPI003D9A2823